MRGAFVHNQVLIEPIERLFLKLGAQAYREHPIRTGRNSPCVDLFVICVGSRIVCEAELSLKRIGNDLIKARELMADLLLLVFPQWRLVHAARQHVRDLSSARHLEIWILPLGPALLRLEKKFGCPAGSIVTESFDHRVSAPGHYLQALPKKEINK